MNILVINWQDWKNPLAGGAELNLYEVFSRLIRRGHNVTLLCSRAQGQKRYEILDGFEIFRIGRRNNFNFFVPCAMRAILRHKKFDIIIDDLNKIPFYSPFFTKRKVVALMHHLFRSAIYRETNPIFASYVYLSESLISIFYRRTSFIAVSQSAANDLRRLGVKNVIHVVHNGIPEVFKDLRESRQKNMIAYVGRVKKYKSIEHFIQAVSIIKKKRNLEVMIVGDGDAREHLMDLAKNLGVEINFTGFVSEEEKIRIYNRAWIVVQPSIKEGWGLTVIEAQSFGTPVVCANSPGLREAIVDGETGYLYPYGNVKVLSDKIIELLDNEEKWHRFSCAASKWASGFTWDNAAEKFERILQKLC